MSLAQRRLSYHPHPNGTKFQTAYGEKSRVPLTFAENSRWTKQSFKDECDINNVMGRYLSTGELPVINQQAPQYLDVTGIEYQNAMEFIAGAQTLFNELPSGVRTRFANDPAQFLDFCSDEKNRGEMAQMGLLSDEATYAYIKASTTPEKPLQSNPGAAPASSPEAPSNGA